MKNSLIFLLLFLIACAALFAITKPTGTKVAKESMDKSSQKASPVLNSNGTPSAKPKKGMAGKGNKNVPQPPTEVIKVSKRLPTRQERIEAFSEQLGLKHYQKKQMREKLQSVSKVCEAQDGDAKKTCYRESFKGTREYIIGLLSQPQKKRFRDLQKEKQIWIP